MNHMGFLSGAYAYLLDTVQTLLIAASVFLVIYVFLFRPYQVNGASMFPTFVDGEYVLTNLIVMRMSLPTRGTVVVFESPIDTEKKYIKRVIGVPGDTVSISNGEVYLNRQRLDESKYLKPEVKTYGGAFMREGQEVTVPEGSVLVMGDNRPYSSDSREWGFLKTNKIDGVSLFVYWPPGNTRVVKNPND